MYATSCAICRSVRIDPQCGMLTIGAFPSTLPERMSCPWPG